MKAIRVHEAGGPEVMKLEEVHDPKPGPGQVVVRIYAVGINPVDTYFRAGIYPPPAHPYTPGSDAAGVIESVGEGVRRVAVGDRVYTAGTVSGAHAERALCGEAPGPPLPGEGTFAQGAAGHVPPATPHLAPLPRAHPRPGGVRPP